MCNAIKRWGFSRFDPATFLFLLQARTWISNTIFHGLCYVQRFQVRVDCSFCWYLWNCWSSLFKLSFHNITTFTVPGLTKWQRPWIIATRFPCINLFLNIHIILNSYRSHISYMSLNNGVSQANSIHSSTEKAAIFKNESMHQSGYLDIN
jgi:hypothetical protein